MIVKQSQIIFFFFFFHWLKDVDEKLKHEIDFFMKNNRSLAEDKIKNEMKQWLSKYKHGKNIHKHHIQENE